MERERTCRAVYYYRVTNRFSRVQPIFDMDTERQSHFYVYRL